MYFESRFENVIVSCRLYKKLIDQSQSTILLTFDCSQFFMAITIYDYVYAIVEWP